MATRRFISLALAAALTGGFAGCTSGFGWGAGRQTATAGSTGVSLVSTQPTPSLGGSVASGLKATTDKVVSVFTIKPKVVEASDPIKLTSKQEPVGAEVYLSAARLHENRGDFEAAAAQYRKALDVSPKSLPALIAFARLQDRQGKFNEAAKLYRKAIVAHPENATPLNDLGLCQARNSQPEAALESMSKAVQLEPQNKLYRNNVAAVLVDLDRSPEAFDHLSHAHGEAIAHYNLGYLYYKRDKLEPAGQQFALAIEQDPSLLQAQEMLNRLSGVARHTEPQSLEYEGDAASYAEDVKLPVPGQAARGRARFNPASPPRDDEFAPRPNSGLQRFPRTEEQDDTSYGANP